MSELKLPIYLDYSSTTPVDPRVAAKMADCLTSDGIFGNPASRSHKFGWVAEEAVEKERREANRLRRHEIYVAAERKRKQDHYDKEEIRIQALISKDLAKDASRVAASKAYFIAEDKRIKDKLAAQQTSEKAMSWSPFS